jgi:sarcosine oxidase subunit beta
MRHATVVIVGSGVIGLSAAYHIARRGVARVIVLEKDAVGAGSSTRAAGITTGLLWTETGVRARSLGIEWFRRLSEELASSGYHYFDEHGCLNLFTPESWPARAALLPLYDRLAVPYAVLNAEEIHRRWPALTPPDGYVGLHDPRGGYSEPEDYLAALSARVRDLGVEIRTGQTVRGLLTTGGRASGVQTDAGPVGADAVISSVHSWGPAVWQEWGLRFPMKSFVHQRYVSNEQDSAWVAPPVNADPLSGYIRPARGRRILLGVETPDRREHDVKGTDFRMTDLDAPVGLIDQAAARFASLAPAVRGARWDQSHVGLIAFSSDGEPILGPVAQFPGLFIAGAFHSGGFSYNTVAGLLLSEMVAGLTTSVDVSAFFPDRFEAEGTNAYLAEPVVQARAVRRRH